MQTLLKHFHIAQEECCWMLPPPPFPGRTGSAGKAGVPGYLSRLQGPVREMATRPLLPTLQSTRRARHRTCSHNRSEDQEMLGQDASDHPLQTKNVVPATVQATAHTNSCAKWCNYHLSCQMASRWSYLSHQQFNKLLGVTFAACPPPAQPSGL